VLIVYITRSHNVWHTVSGSSTHISLLLLPCSPKAQLYFHTACDGEADFAAGIVKLQEAGCQVIVDDVFYSEEASAGLHTGHPKASHSYPLKVTICVLGERQDGAGHCITCLAWLV
jgi:hypothetical protein